MTQRLNHPRVDEIERITKLLMDTWAKVDSKSGPAQHPTSYIATFVDMARAVVEDAEPAHATLTAANVATISCLGDGCEWDTTRALSIAERIALLDRDRDVARQLAETTAKELATMQSHLVGDGDRAERLNRAAERLVFIQHIYRGYKVESRGPNGCIWDALVAIAPNVADDVERLGWDEAYAKHWTDEGGQREESDAVQTRTATAGVSATACPCCTPACPDAPVPTEPLALARFTIAKYGAGANKPSVRLATEVLRLTALINTPRTDEFFEAVRIEAAHQIERWGVEHDAGKRAEDWLALYFYLLGKAAKAHFAGDREKLLHHIVTVAAVALNWHRNMTGVSTAMRPGVEEVECNYTVDGARVCAWKGPRSALIQYRHPFDPACPDCGSSIPRSATR